MRVTTDQAIARISANGTTTLFVNVNNAETYSYIRKQLVTMFTVKISNYFTNNSDLPDSDRLISEVKEMTKPVVVLGLLEYLAFKDGTELRQTLSEVGKLGKHIIILCSHLETLFNEVALFDIRYKERMLLIEGENDILPSLTLFKFPIKAVNCFNTFKEYLHSIEERGSLTAMVVSELSQKIFENGIWPVKTIDSAYDALSFILPNFSELYSYSFGTENQWFFLYKEITSGKTTCYSQFGVELPENAIENYLAYTEMQRWLLLYFIKSSLSNNYAILAAKQVMNINEFVEKLYSYILEIDNDADNFEYLYRQRKKILSSINDEVEAQKFCNLANCKESNKIFYLTDLTELEQKEYIKCIGTYKYDSSKLKNTLEKNYPQLGYYLSFYYFDISFWSTVNAETGLEVKHDLGEYFEKYKFQKLKNSIDSDFIELVNAFAIDKPRKFIVELPTRSMIAPALENVIWIDALGVEYLGFIVKVCDVLGLKVNIKIARAEMPTLTRFNKEFFDISRGDVKVSDLDELKHSGVGEYDYSKTTLPLYIINELKIIEQVLKTAKTKVVSSGKPVTIMSDHGASRLVRIYGNTITVDAEVDGKHGGRCCIWEDGLSECSPYASDNENGYCVLANYDRFSGGKYTGVELHGGASLEEIIVPIIELSIKNTSISAIFKEKRIKVNRGKAEDIVVTLSTVVDKLRLKIDETYFEPSKCDNTTYTFEVSIGKVQKYRVSLLDDNQVLQENVELEFFSAIAGTRDLFL